MATAPEILASNHLLVYHQNREATTTLAATPVGMKWVSIRGKPVLIRERPKGREVADRKEEHRFEAASPEAFVAARDKSDRPQFLTPYTAEELGGFELRKHPTLDVGYAISPEGEVVNGFNNSGHKGMGSVGLLQAIGEGARKLDCFEGPLVDIYAGLGFREVERVPWDDEYAPADWDYEKYGRPDVVHMEHGGFDDVGDLAASYQALRNRGVGDDSTTRAALDRVYREIAERTRRGVVRAESATPAGPAEDSLPRGVTFAKPPPGMKWLTIRGKPVLVKERRTSLDDRLRRVSSKWTRKLGRDDESLADFTEELGLGRDAGLDIVDTMEHHRTGFGTAAVSGSLFSGGTLNEKGRVLHAYTQAILRNNGISSLKVYRGQVSGERPQAKVRSWSASRRVAQNYASGKAGSVVEAAVEARRILVSWHSSSRLPIGEREVLVLE